MARRRLEKWRRYLKKSVHQKASYENDKKSFQKEWHEGYLLFILNHKIFISQYRKCLLNRFI